ncbi:MAG TPA: alpha/beta hydrolase [Mycobacteriales bacterium]|nr:alpha/beta hydrolase [Mycobacteriales bacterium]
MTITMPPATPMPAKVRMLLRTMSALQRIGLAPTATRMLKKPVDVRRAQKPLPRLLDPTPEGVVLRDVSLPGPAGAPDVPARLYTPATAAAGAIPVLYIHGGGWTVGGLPACEHICQRIAAGASAVVVSVDYRLAPEDPYPAALDDCWAALAWLISEATALEVDLARLVIAGDSAGGNLTAACVLLARKHGVHVAGQALIYPALDHTMSSPSVRGWRSAGLAIADLELASSAYCGDHDPADPLLSPLLEPDLAGIPPALILTAGHDPLREEAFRYADRLREAGIPVEHSDYPGYAHGFFSLPKLWPGVEGAWSTLTDWIAQH